MKMRNVGTNSVVLLVGVLFISACGSGEVESTPTISVDMVQTLAVATYASGLTETVIALPTETPTSTQTPTSTFTSTPAQTNTPGTTVQPTTGSLPVNSCLGLAFVADVTIPDNTNMRPAEKFTKTWRVKNNGSCNWEAGFNFNFVGGEAMGGSSLGLGKVVTPGTETELSLALTAPNTTGTFRGNWRMTNAAGAYFGDEVYVLIVVSGSASTSTQTMTITPTITLSPTETPIETTTS